MDLATGGASQAFGSIHQQLADATPARPAGGRRAGDHQSGHIPRGRLSRSGFLPVSRLTLTEGFDGKDSAERRRIHPVRTARYSRRTISKSSSAEVAAAWLSKVISPCCISTTRSQISNVAGGDGA